MTDSDTTYRDTAIAVLFIGTILAAAVFHVQGMTGSIPALVGGAVLLGIAVLAIHHLRQQRTRKTGEVRSRIGKNALGPGDLDHIQSLLRSSATEIEDGLDLLSMSYTQDGTERSLIGFIAQDSHQASRSIVDAVIDLLEHRQDRIRRQAVSLLHTTSLQDHDQVQQAADTMFEDLEDADDLGSTEVNERAVFLARNRTLLDPDQVRDHRGLIYDLLTTGNAGTDTMGALLVQRLVRQEQQVDPGIGPQLVTNLDAMLDVDQDHDTFITALLGVLHTIAYTDPSVFEDRMDVLAPCFDRDRTDRKRATGIARTVAQHHPRALEPIFDDLVGLLDDEDPEIQRRAVEALAHMGPRVTQGQDTFAGRLVPLLETDDERRRAAAFLLFKLAGDHPGTVAGAIDDLEDLITDETARIRRYGFGILRELAPAHPGIVRQHLPAIRQALEDDGAAGDAALNVLYRYGTDHDMTVVEDMGQQLVPYLDEDGPAGGMATELLAEAVIADPDRYSGLRPLLEELLDRDDPYVLVQACRALAEIGTAETKERLQGLLGGDEHAVNVAAAKAYTAIGERVGDGDTDRNPLEGAQDRLQADREAIVEMLAEEQDGSIQIDSDGDINGDILIYGDKEVTEIDDSTEIRDSIQKDVEMDGD